MGLGTFGTAQPFLFKPLEDISLVFGSHLAKPTIGPHVFNASEYRITNVECFCHISRQLKDI